MRRSICYCEPATALAGEVKTWRFIFTPATTLPKGCKLKFDLQSKGREIDWEIPSTDLKKEGGIIYALMAGKKLLPAQEVFPPEESVPQYEFTLPSALNAGEEFVIVLGAKEEGERKGKGGLRAQTVSQRRRAFSLYINLGGKQQYGEPELFSLDVKGGALEHVRVLAQSFVSKNKRFDLTVRFEDEYGNLTGNAPADTVIELSHENLRDNLKWRLFVPETGFITLPNLYFNDEGVYTVSLKNTATNQIFRSPPIKCFAEQPKNLFWGLLHGESERFDATESIESCLRHFRDDKAYHFYATSCFESVEETPNEVWKSLSQHIADFNEDERFTSFLGFQWVGAPKAEGCRLFIYAKDQKPILRNKDLKYNQLKKIYKNASPKELLSIPTFTMGKGFEYNFAEYNPDFERVVEIYHAWGSSELTKKEGNDRPITSSDNKGIQETAEGSLQKALLRNCRFGFVAGGLDDRGIYGTLYDSNQIQYAPGLTAIMAANQSRDALFEALYQRSCYATTGERIILGLHVAGASMGKEISTADKPGLLVNRHLTGYVAGTATLEKVEIVRNGQVLQTFHPKHYSFDFSYDDMTPLDRIAVDAKDGKPPFVYYYLRVTQTDAHMAWSSPIWVDCIDWSQLPKPPIKRPPTKPAQPQVSPELQQLFQGEDEESDEEEEF